MTGVKVPPHFSKTDRETLTRQYHITPVRRFQCVPGKPIDGLYKDVGGIAYQFTAYPFSAPNDVFTFYTGQTAGRDFLKILGASLPLLQTWESVSAPTGSGGGGSGRGGPSDVSELDPFNEQLLWLLNLFFLKNSFDPTKPSAQAFDDINKNPGVPQRKAAYTLNTILGRFGETSASLENWLIANVDGKKVRPIKCDLVRDYLASKDVSPLHVL